MRRGTTPTLEITVAGLTQIEVEELYLTLKQGDAVIEKTKNDVTIDCDVITAELTQEDTLKLTANLNVQMQIRAISPGGTAYASNIVSIPVNAILKDGVIPSD